MLPVGGIKEKVLAALRAGITTALLPSRNRKEWDEIPPSARDKPHIIWIDQVHEALTAVLMDPQAV